jgi:hypothetical protein
MRIFVALLIVLAALYFWDVNYNNGTLSDGVIRMKRSIRGRKATCWRTK